MTPLGVLHPHLDEEELGLKHVGILHSYLEEEEEPDMKHVGSLGSCTPIWRSLEPGSLGSCVNVGVIRCLISGILLSCICIWVGRQ
jgi:hypothetical protein